MSTQMSVNLQKALEAMPLLPNVEYEIRRSGVPLETYAELLDISAELLGEKLRGKEDLYADELVSMRELFLNRSLDYLLWTPRVLLGGDPDKDRGKTLDLAAWLMQSLYGSADDLQACKDAPPHNTYELHSAMNLIAALVNAYEMGWVPDNNLAKAAV